MDPKSFKSTPLRGKTVQELEASLNELKVELAALRVNQVSQGVAAKLAKIGVSLNLDSGDQRYGSLGP